MSHSHSRVHSTYVCSIVPPYILRSIAEKGTATQRDVAAKTLADDVMFRAQRQLQPPAPEPREFPAAPPHKNRLIYDGKHRKALPGKLVRGEGQAAGSDVAVNEAYDGLGATFDLYCDIYGRNSIDNNGMDIIGTVHYGRKYDNAQWNGFQMIFGDGDGTIFNRFTIAVDIMGHELTHGVTGATARLDYQDQAGALNESVSDVFGSLVKQRVLNQKAAEADWLIG
ncbi:MAG: M4 family metallopeptidase, partial [Nitrososphaerales archaeon]